MFNFVLGIVFGIIISTVGFSAFANMADSGVHKVKQVTKQVIEQ